MWLIAGLGNPGVKYDQTRHNAGFWFVEELARKAGASLGANRRLHGRAVKTEFADCAMVLLAPDTFMNESGQSLRAATDFYRIRASRVLVAHDELDLQPGIVRLKKDGGHGGHNGLRSSFSHLNTPDFWRLRIGIGHPGIASQVTPWVLSRAPAEDQRLIDDSIDRSIAVMPDFLNDRANDAMKILHAKPKPADSSASPAK
ncbi:MAG: aminoacyl-tRNA hydrolase [Pseudomonadota bacterium]